MIPGDMDITGTNHPGFRVTDTDHFEEDVLNNPLPVLLDFWGPSCAPCIALMPILDRLAARHEGQLAAFKIHSRENWRVAVRLGVTSLPTILLLKGGIEKVRLTGDISPADVEAAIRKLLVGG